MAKKDANVKKVCGKKKINHYSVADCKAEIHRLDTSFKNKKGESIPDTSKYRDQVEERLALLNLAELRKIPVPVK
jgi:hypothetical protein